MESHFGQWVKRLRGRLGESQEGFAKILGLESAPAVYQMEQKQKRSIRNATLESLLDLTGFATAEELDQHVERGEFPPLDVSMARRDARAIILGIKTPDKKTVELLNSLVRKEPEAIARLRQLSEVQRREVRTWLIAAQEEIERGQQPAAVPQGQTQAAGDADAGVAGAAEKAAKESEAKRKQLLAGKQALANAKRKGTPPDAKGKAG